MKRLQDQQMHQDVQLIALNGGYTGQPVQHLTQTKDESSRKKYAGVINQKLRLFNRGNSHIRSTYLHKEQASFQNHQS